MSTLPQPDPYLTEAQVREYIDGFRKGEPDAVAALVSHSNRKFRRMLRKKLRGGLYAHKIDDVLQDAWKRAYQFRHHYDPEVARFDVWFYRIVINCANDVLRRSRREVSTVSYDAIDEASAERVREYRDVSPAVSAGSSSPAEPGDPRQLAILREVLTGLRREYQEMLQFFATYKGDDWQYQYSKLMGIKRSTLRSRFSRALQKLKKGMARREQGGAR